MDTNKRSLAFPLVACLIIALVAIVAVSRFWLTNAAVVYSLNLKNREAVEQAVDIAIVNPRTVIYVSVDWSATAVAGHREFERFATEWQRTRPAPAVSFHCIDFSSTSTSTPNYSPITSLPGWAETRGQIHGNGELAWVVDGRIVDVGRIGFGASKELIQKTDRLFTESNGAESNGDAPSNPLQ